MPAPPRVSTVAAVPVPAPPRVPTVAAVSVPAPPRVPTGSVVPVPPPPRLLTGGAVSVPAPPPRLLTGSTVPVPPPPRALAGPAVPVPVPPPPEVTVPPSRVSKVVWSTWPSWRASNQASVGSADRTLTLADVDAFLQSEGVRRLVEQVWSAVQRCTWSCVGMAACECADLCVCVSLRRPALPHGKYAKWSCRRCVKNGATAARRYWVMSGRTIPSSRPPTSLLLHRLLKRDGLTGRRHHFHCASCVGGPARGCWSRRGPLPSNRGDPCCCLRRPCCAAPLP